MRFLCIRLTVRRMMTALVIVGIILAMGTETTGRFAYCTRCGLCRFVMSRTWFGIPTHSTAEYLETEYRGLYREFVLAECGHRWQGYSVSHSCRPGEVRRPMVLGGSFPRLGDDPIGVGLAPLKRLGDRSKIAEVLTSFNLAGGNAVVPGDLEHAAFALPAIAELKSASTSAAAERWWTNHQSLFVRPSQPASTFPAQ
jgi:hypothetical protein